MTELKELTFTKEEIEVVNNYLAHRLNRLEECGLEDSYCYPRILAFRCKLLHLEDTMKNSKEICLQIKKDVL